MTHQVSWLFLFFVLGIALRTPQPVQAISPTGLAATGPPSLTPTPSETPAVSDADGELRDRLQDVVGRLQSIASLLRGITQDTRLYTREVALERGLDGGPVDRRLTRVEDQLSRADAQVVALAQLSLEIEAGRSAQDVLSRARSQTRIIRRTLLSARDLLRDALDALRVLHQMPTPTETTVLTRVTAAPTP